MVEIFDPPAWPPDDGSPLDVAESALLWAVVVVDWLAQAALFIVLGMWLG